MTKPKTRAAEIGPLPHFPSPVKQTFVPREGVDPQQGRGGERRGREYIEIVDAGTSKTGITRKWDVRNTRTDDLVGQIRWYGGWRRYAFFPETSLYDLWVAVDEEVLGKVLAKLRELNEGRRGARRIG